MSQETRNFPLNQVRTTRNWRSRILSLKSLTFPLGRHVLRGISSISPFEPIGSGRSLPEKDYRWEDQFIHLGWWFIRMRWIACIVATLLIVLTIKVLHYLEAETFWPLIISVGCLVATNILFSLLLQHRLLIRRMLEIQIGTDLVILTAMLHYSGGIENPLAFAYIFHVIIGGILLNRRKAYAVVAVATLLYSAMALGEMQGILHHYTLLIFPHPHEGGAEHLFHASHQPLFVGSLVVLQFILLSLTAYFTTTIMEQLHSEERCALADRQRLERVVQATGAGLTILDRNLRPIWLNDQIKMWLNLSAEIPEQLTKRLESWIGGKDGPAELTFMDGAARVVERELVNAQGNTQIFQVTIAPLLDSAGHAYQVVELTQDITRRKMVEAEMIHSAKMASLGLMAAGIVHEVGNPLSSISTRLRLLEEKHDEKFLKESLRLLKSQLGRIGRILHGVSQFARSSKDGWSSCQINQLVEETLNVLRLHQTAKSRQINAELAEALPETMGDRDQLVQVFLNLGLNALEAMLHNGKLTVKTCTKDGVIRIGFRDTGEGINGKVRSRIFDPFFSVKDKGLGLGLCIAHNIINAHGGRIEVESVPGAGSLLTVVLPIRSPEKRFHERTVAL